MRIEFHIQEGLQTLMEGRTSFVIAHRLSTIKKANTILVMQEGEIVETGAHEDLLKKKGVYHDLYHRQFGTKTIRTERGGTVELLTSN